MAQTTTGLRRVLSSAPVYQAFQDLLGARRLYRRLAADFVEARPGQRVLDIGCGPAALLAELPAGVDYHGFDTSTVYIEAARRRFGDRGTFWAARVDQATLADLPPFDAVVAIGVVHHLDDDEAGALFDLAWRALRPGGRVVTYDPCFRDGQSPIARWLVGRDRGQNVRRPEGYQALARPHFADARVTVLDGHLRVPYTATVLTAIKS